MPLTMPVLNLDEKMTGPRRPLSTRRSPIRIGAGIFIVLVSATGFLLLSSAQDPAAGSSLDDLSSSGAFLERDATAQPRGLDRLTYQIGDERVVIPNHGTVPLSDDLVLEVSVSPYPPTSFDLDVEFVLRTVQGGPIADATIDAIWDMTIMHHGPFEAQFKSVGDGRYAAFFDLFMVGPWGLDINLSVPGYQNPDGVTVIIYVWPE
jgi:hypothetical protein